jgi:anti-sigma B factor antagonist
MVDVRISVSRFGADSFVLAVGGELDLYTAEPLKENLADVLDQGARCVLIDLTGVSFIDSTALAVLVDTAKALRSSRGQMVLVADDPRITRVMEITGLDRVFPVSSSLQEGVQELVGQRRQS